MKYKRKVFAKDGVSTDTKKRFKASGGAWSTAGTEAVEGGVLGASIGSLIPGVGTVIGGAAGAVIGGAYGYISGSAEDKARKPDRPLYSYNLAGTGKNRAGSVSGANTFLQKTLSGTDRSGTEKADSIATSRNTVNGIAGGVSSLARVVKSSIKTDPNKLPQPKPIETSLINSDLTIGKSISTLQPKDLSTTLSSTINPERTSMFPQSKNAGFSDTLKIGSPLASSANDPTNIGIGIGKTNPFGDNTTDNDIFGQSTLFTGGKNKKGAVPVEAEGGEVEVAFDDKHNVLSMKPLKGPSHSSGGIDMKLPKNHAILNKEQQGRMKGGESLKSILARLPNVNGEKAQEGKKNDYPPWWQFMSTNPDVIGSPNLYTILNPDQKGTQQSIDIPGAPTPTGKNDPNYLPNPNDYLADQSMLKGLKPTAPKSAGFEDPNAVKGDWKKDFPGDVLGEGSEPISSWDMEAWTPKQKDAYLGSMPETDLSGKTPSGSPGGTPPGEKKFGEPEQRAIANTAANLISVFQPRAQGVHINPSHVGSPATVTPHYLNPKSTLDEVGKQVRTGIMSLIQTGRSDAIPSLISAGMEATNKVGEQYAGVNSQMESKAQEENARSSNEFSLAQSSLDQDTMTKNATLEMKTLEQRGLQDSERYKALQSLMYIPAQYERDKMDQRIRNIAYENMSVDLFFKQNKK
jgi:hypothetical protein